MLFCWLKLSDIISEATLRLPERYQNIEDIAEYYSALSFRIILKIFSVNMLNYNIKFTMPSWRRYYNVARTNSEVVYAFLNIELHEYNFTLVKVS